MDDLEKTARFRNLRNRVHALLKQCASDAMIGALPSEEQADATVEKQPETPNAVSAAHVLNAMVDYLGNKVQPIRMYTNEDEQPIELRYNLSPDRGFTKWPGNFPYKPGDSIVLNGKSPEGKAWSPVTIPLPPNGEIFMRVLEQFFTTGTIPSEKMIAGEEPFLAQAAGLIPDQFMTSLREKAASAKTLAELNKISSHMKEELQQAIAETHDTDIYQRLQAGLDMIEETAATMIRAGFDSSTTIDELHEWDGNYTSLGERASPDWIADDAEFVFQNGTLVYSLRERFSDRAAAIIRDRIGEAHAVADLGNLASDLVDTGYVSENIRGLLVAAICAHALKIVRSAAEASKGNNEILEDIGHKIAEFPFPEPTLPDLNSLYETYNIPQFPRKSDEIIEI